MLYLVLKPLMKAALSLYFRRIVPCNLKYIDKEQPTIILANHTASFMDAVITACFVKRRIHFFTRGDIFSNSGAERVMRSLGMLPIYRLVDGKDMLQHNERSNNEALGILQNGGAVLIFCEGVSDVAPLLKPLKKGPFRLAAKAQSCLGNPLALVPLGINYVNPIQPFGDAFLVANNAITNAGQESDAAKMATQTMRATDAALKPLVWHVPDTKRQALASICLSALQEIKPIFSFEESQKMLGHLQADNTATEQLLMSYEGIKHYSKKKLLSAFSKVSIQDFLILILFWPIAFFGAVANFPPIALASVIAQKKVSAIDFKAPVFLSLATIISVVWLLLLLILGIVFFNPVATIIALASIILSGCILLKVYRRPWAHFQDWLLRKRAQNALIGAFQIVLKNFLLSC